MARTSKASIELQNELAKTQAERDAIRFSHELMQARVADLFGDIKDKLAKVEGLLNGSKPTEPPQ